MTPKRMTLTVLDGTTRDMQEGDFIRSTRSKYVVVTSRKVNTRDGAIRWALGVVNVDEIPDGVFVWWMRWDSRRRKP